MPASTSVNVKMLNVADGASPSVNVKKLKVVDGGVDFVDGGGYRGAMEHV